MGRVDGKVAFITGGARGQGRAHAVTFAREGADVVVTDLCEQIEWVEYPMATEEDLQETVRQVEALGRRAIGIKADSRDPEAMQAAVGRTIEELGHIDILAVNHGIAPLGGWEESTLTEWRDVIDTMLMGVWYSTRPVIPHMIEQGGGAIVMTSSVAGMGALYAYTSYTAAKHGVIGIMRSLSAELGAHNIRVNAVCPSTTLSPMVDNDAGWLTWTGGKSNKMEDAVWPAKTMGLLPVPWMEPEAISDAVLFLSCDESKYITGVALPVDMGALNQPNGVPPIAWERIGQLEYELEHKP
jgi:(+)-trans-carveol dehydrogenase